MVTQTYVPYSFNSPVDKTPQKHKLDNPIAASFAGYRVASIINTPYHLLTDNIISDEDLVTANEAKEYYLGRYLLKRLSGRELTKYQTALCTMLQRDFVYEDELGILYQLPYFYNQDLESDKIPEICKSLPYPGYTSYVAMDRKFTITPLVKVAAYQKQTKGYQYWFKDADDYAACLHVNYSNNLSPLMDFIFNKKEPITINATWTLKPLFHITPEFHYRSLSKFEMI